MKMQRQLLINSKCKPYFSNLQKGWVLEKDENFKSDLYSPTSWLATRQTFNFRGAYHTFKWQDKYAISLSIHTPVFPMPIFDFDI